ncbi:MAG: type II secretion system F family protein [Candidatus Acidiferrales bacterium]
MVWLVSGATFLVTFTIVAALVYALTTEQSEIAVRLARLRDSPAPVEREGFAEKQKLRARGALVSLGHLLPAAAELRASRAQLKMIRAGYRSADARSVMRGVKVVLPVALLALVLLSGACRYSPIPILLLAAGAGVLLPEMWLQWRAKVRRRRLRLALPDGLDLLVICVEVGLGLDQSLLRVAQELRVVHPDLSEELQIVNLEMRVGKTRIDALRELARRTNLDDIRTLVAMLIQTERFGTSIAQSLRVHSDELRTKRRQRAEERSAKTSVKMVVPLVLFIFPALMVVVLGPAIISLVRQLTPALR